MSPTVPPPDPLLGCLVFTIVLLSIGLFIYLARGAYNAHERRRLQRQGRHRKIPGPSPRNRGCTHPDFLRLLAELLLLILLLASLLTWLGYEPPLW